MRLCIYYCIFRNKLTLEAVKLQSLLFLFTQLYRVSMIKAKFSHNYLKNIILCLQNNINMLGDLKTDAESLARTPWKKRFILISMGPFWKNKGFIIINNNTYLRAEELWFESCLTTVRQNSSNLHIRKFKWQVASTNLFYISFAFFNPIG